MMLTAISADDDGGVLMTLVRYNTAMRLCLLSEKNSNLKTVISHGVTERLINSHGRKLYRCVNKANIDETENK